MLTIKLLLHILLPVVTLLISTAPVVDAFSISSSSPSNRKKNSNYIIRSHARSSSSSSRYATSNEPTETLNPLIDFNRRSFLSIAAAATATLTPKISDAIEDDTSFSLPHKYTQIKDGFRYTFTPPQGFTTGKKPVKTHLDEINFSSKGAKGYQYGITVDPVRIETLKQFGTPSEVAQRVIEAEQNRDGVYSVQLYGTPMEDTETGSFVMEYISDGKRGTKHYITKIFVKNNYLIVLTAQVLEKEYEERREELEEAIKTFQVDFS